MNLCMIFELIKQVVFHKGISNFFNHNVLERKFYIVVVTLNNNCYDTMFSLSKSKGYLNTQYSCIDLKINLKLRQSSIIL